MSVLSLKEVICVTEAKDEVRPDDLEDGLWYEVVKDVRLSKKELLNVVPVGVKKFGTFNTFPEPHEYITEEEFKKNVLIHGIDMVDYRQVSDGGYKYIELMIFWNHMGGFGFDNKGNYYRFGCNHEFVELSPKESAKYGIQHYGCCYHVYRCKKCGKIEVQDSSD